MLINSLTYGRRGASMSRMDYLWVLLLFLVLLKEIQGF